MANGPAADGTLAPVIAHRGASGMAPENTLAALAMAADQGASHVEIDVSISSDGVPFVHHDDTLDRCTNGTGNLCDRTAAELDELTADMGLEEFIGEPLPRLQAVITLLESRGVGLNLEIKPKAGLEVQTTEAICHCIEYYWPSGLTLVLSSYERSCLDTARQLLPGVPRALLVEAVPDDWQRQLERYHCRNLHCLADVLKPETASAIEQADIGLYCYTVNEVEQARRLWAMGVSGVFTDYPARMLAGLLAVQSD